MTTPSTVAVIALSFVVGAFVGAITLALIRRRRRNPEALARAAYLRKHAVRFALAQHWAKGGVLSDRSEPWRPICTGVAVAALLLDDDSEVEALLNATIGETTADAELTNIWRQARAELLAARDRLELEFLAGVRPDGSPTWNQSVLRARAVEVLESAQKGADALLAARRVPSVPPSAG